MWHPADEHWLTDEPELVEISMLEWTELSEW
jgi:hypothetical protein